MREEEQQAINASIQHWVARLKLRKQLDGELLVRNIARNDTPEIDTSKVVLEFENGADVVVVGDCDVYSSKRPIVKMTVDEFLSEVCSGNSPQLADAAGPYLREEAVSFFCKLDAHCRSSRYY